MRADAIEKALAQTQEKNLFEENDMTYNLPQKQSEILIYQTDEGRVKLDVRLEDETVWLTQPLMAELFQTSQQNISQHILNIYEEGELIF